VTYLALKFVNCNYTFPLKQHCVVQVIVTSVCGCCDACIRVLCISSSVINVRDVTATVCFVICGFHLPSSSYSDADADLSHDQSY